MRGFSPTEKVLIANYHTTVDSHLSPQKEGELCFSYTDTEAKKAFLEILDRYVIFRSPWQVYGGMGEDVYRLMVDITDTREKAGVLSMTVYSTGDFSWATSFTT